MPRKIKKNFLLIFIILFIFGAFVFYKEPIKWGIGIDEYHSVENKVDDASKRIGITLEAGSYSPKNYYLYDGYKIFIKSVSGECKNTTTIKKMYSLAEYLKENGVIEDNFSEISLVRTPNGKGASKIYSDDNYVYLIFDNGIKESQYGNKYLEFVLVNQSGTDYTVDGFYL